MAKIALLIGVSDYISELKPLPAAIHDVAAMQRVLENREIGGFDEVITLINPTSSNMAEQMEVWFGSRLSSDLAVLFFSGHGIKDEKRNLYLAAHNTRKRQEVLVKTTAVAANIVHEFALDSKAKRQVIILDCCFSGAFGNLIAKDDETLDLENQLGAEGRVILTSSSSLQYSFEQKGSNLSIYTRYLVEGIETGAADKDGDGKISIHELHKYASRRVRESAPSMTPKIFIPKDEGFEIIIANVKVNKELEYRKAVQKYANRGKISVVGSTRLTLLRKELELSLGEAEQIQNEVLAPYQIYLENLDLYEQTLISAMNEEPKLDETTLQELQDLEISLALKKEDVETLEQKVFLLFAPKPALKEQVEQIDVITAEKETRKLQDQSQLISYIQNSSSTQVWQCIHTLKHNSTSVYSIVISPDSQTLVSGGDDGSLMIWKLDSGKLIRTISWKSTFGESDTSCITSAVVTPNGQMIASGNLSKFIKLWDWSSGKLTRSLKGHSDSVRSIAISADGQNLISGSRDSTIKIWNLAAGKVVHTFGEHSDSVDAVAISQDTKILVSGSRDSTVKIWDFSSKKLLTTFTGHSDWIRSVAVNSHRNVLVSGSRDQTVKLWDLSNRAIMHTLTEHSDWVTSVLISSDGDFLISGSRDKTINIWEISSGQLLCKLTDHLEGVCCVSISSDGRTLVSSSDDGEIKNWRRRS